jgi:hypothetical protein
MEKCVLSEHKKGCRFQRPFLLPKILVIALSRFAVACVHAQIVSHGVNRPVADYMLYRACVSIGSFIVQVQNFRKEPPDRFMLFRYPGRHAFPCFCQDYAAVPAILDQASFGKRSHSCACRGLVDRHARCDVRQARPDPII